MDKNTAIENFHLFLRNYNLDSEDVSISYMYTTIHNLLENDKNIRTQEFFGTQINFFERDYSILKNAADADEPVAQFILGYYLWNQGGGSLMREGVRYIKISASNGYEVASNWLEKDKEFLSHKDSYDVQL